MSHDTKELAEIDRLIRSSAVGEGLVEVRADPNRDDIWARFKWPGRQPFRVQTDLDTAESAATDLIEQAQARRPGD